MDPYAKPKERNIGARRPKIRHMSQSVEPRTRRERQAEKQGVAAERRAIKKAARRHLKEQLLRELDEKGYGFCITLSVAASLYEARRPQGGDYSGQFVSLSFEIVTLRLRG